MLHADSPRSDQELVSLGGKFLRAALGAKVVDLPGMVEFGRSFRGIDRHAADRILVPLAGTQNGKRIVR